MADQFDPLQLTADVNWQIAKGYLNAVVAVQGARHSGDLDGEETKYARLKREVEGFVKHIEEEELNL